MKGRILAQMKKGSKYDTVSASIIHSGHQAGWSHTEINDMLVNAGRVPLTKGSYGRFVSQITKINSCVDEKKRQNALDAWLCRTETSSDGLEDLLD